ncbi:aminopeptidase N [Thalassotalea piscium]|nr:aminopeptidase N [Thalassotalea piscium]
MIIVSTFVLSACNQASNSDQNNINKDVITDSEIPTFSVRANNAHLSEAQAMQRSKRVSDVDYKLTFELTGEESFSATSVINFQLNDASSPLTVDLNEASINKLTVNGKDVTADYNNWFITLAPADLNTGKNSVAVSFTRKHSTNGEGLHRFVDPVDGKVYLYSHFEPAAAQQMFALFDQPDLKANYQMTVTSPANWHVLSAMKETRSEIKGDKKVWYFDRTLKLSPYNFSLHAGPYHKWEDNTGKYPLRLFVRQSVEQQVVPQDWFNYTHKGLAFFEDYYGVDYPFRKYDQVLVPDFIYGAMENAAAITFGEGGFLTNGEMSQSQKQRLASVIMHEMAHQWFGNLVTMKWWNGLWLNESFAAFMATLATAEATEFDNAWRSFYAYGKQSAYRQDQQITTHPIEVPIPSSANAFDNIDAITYSKGASTLNQLRHLLGETTFRRGIHNYLAKNAYQNAELDDFIESLADASGKNLDNWKQEWLYKAGVNTIQSNFACENGKITEFNLLQTADENFPTLREQHVQVALFSIDKKGLNLTENVAVTYRGNTTSVAPLIGSKCPDLVYPNYQDWGFVKVNLDAKSFETAKSNLSKVDDPLLRSMLWQALWDSVRDGQLPLNDFIDTAIANAPLETDYTILGQALSQIAQSASYIKNIYTMEHSYVQETLQKLEKMAWDNTLANINDTNKLRRWFGYYQSFATSDKGMNTLVALLNGDQSIENLTINQDLRWGIIRHLNRYQHPQALALLEKEQQADNSDTGIKSAISAQVIRPDTATKTLWLANIHATENPMPYAKLRAAMGAMYPSEQTALNELTADSRIAMLAEVDKAHDHVFMRTYAGTMIPTSCTTESVARLEKAIADNKDLSTGTKRALLVAHQNNKRCLVIKNKISIK